jgi:hypothetical protein
MAFSGFIYASYPRSIDMPAEIKASIDTRRFQRDLNLYLKTTSKTIEDAVNFKLYDCARAAIKGTGKADKKKVKETLDASCNRYPERTVAEMLVIMANHKTGVEVFDLENEAKKLKNKRYSSIGFTKAGWIPALKKLLSYVGRETATVAGVMKAAFGGAEPARTSGGQTTGTVFNDVAGTGNRAFVESLKEQGAQAGIDKVTLDMESYLSKKLDIPAERFNQS